MEKQTKQKRLKVSEIRKKLWKLQMELNKVTGINSLTGQYKIKVAYMLMWMRLIPIEKKTLKGWSMPDMETISEFTKTEANKILDKLSKMPEEFERLNLEFINKVRKLI
jgi:hypothetical protein